MLVLAVDPVALAIPAQVKSRDEALSILERLRSLHRYLQRSRRSQSIIQVRVPEDASIVLEDAGYYPHGDRVKQLFDLFDFDGVYSRQDIHSTISTILDRGRSLENCLPLRFVVCGESSIVPEIHRGCHRSFGSKLDEMFRLIAASSDCSHNPSGLIAVTTTCLDPDISTVQVHADVQMADPDDPFEGRLPCTVKEAVSVCEGVSDYFRSLVPANVWQVADGAHLIHFAIRLAVQRLFSSQGREVELDDVPRFRIGAGFLSSLRECQAEGVQPFAAVVLDDCARVVAGTVGGYLTKFRESAKSSKQRTRRADGATAWRLHVTSRHNALRLMVWRRPDGAFEFANLGNKMEEWIDEGDPSLAFEPDEAD